MDCRVAVDGVVLGFGGGSCCVLRVFIGYSCSDIAEGKVIRSGYRFLISSDISSLIVSSACWHHAGLYALVCYSVVVGICRDLC